MDFTPLPDWAAPHIVRIRPYLGRSSTGPVYGPARDVRAFAMDERKVVRDRTGAEVVSESEVHVDFDQDVPTDSLVTVWPGTGHEREARVITTSRHHHPTIWSYQTLSLT